MKRCYNIRQVTLSGESGDVSHLTVESWKERLLELARGYKAEDMWNLDETGWFWKALPDKEFGLKKRARIDSRLLSLLVQQVRKRCQ